MFFQNALSYIDTDNSADNSGYNSQYCKSTGKIFCVGIYFIFTESHIDPFFYFSIKKENERKTSAKEIGSLCKAIADTDSYGCKCRDVSLLSSQSVRNNNPPAMRVRDRCYTKKSPFRSIIELFKLNNTNRKVILWLIKRTAYLTQNGCANII